MTELSGEQNLSSSVEQDEPSTFESIFFCGCDAVPLKVPDYQRAYSWEKKQIDMFIQDLDEYQDSNKGYYFGHFIVEHNGVAWEIVDGQQRITTYVLFLMVCRYLLPTGDHDYAYKMIDNFSTVSYDSKLLNAVISHLDSFFHAYEHLKDRKPPSDEQIINSLKTLPLTEKSTRSLKRMAFALLRFYQAFQNEKLDRDKIGNYITAVMKAHCSHHLTRNKSVAVNIFEMHNTRGVPLTTLDILKAMLMKFVYDHGGVESENYVKKIQDEFGQIYGMEELLAASSFRGEMTMDQLLRLHLRVVDDGTKNTEKDFHYPAANASAESLIEYVDMMLSFEDGYEKNPKKAKAKADGVKYALNLAKEFKKSVRIVDQDLPIWDKADRLVGDVLILERDLSCQFFLIICRRLETAMGECNGLIGNETLRLWEKLLFTRDFHVEYYNLKGGRDNFPKLFASIGIDEASVLCEIQKYLTDGFRTDHTKGLQSIVKKWLVENEDIILNNAFNWWKHKMIYAIYKYEIHEGANIRDVMKGTISVEHILPQDWYWIKEDAEHWKEMSGVNWDSFRKEIEGCINGIGNLLLITPGENSSLGKKHPADKKYERYCSGGSYKEHDTNPEQWRDPGKWEGLIHDRGKKIFDYMLRTLVDTSENLQA